MIRPTFPFKEKVKGIKKEGLNYTTSITIYMKIRKSSMEFYITYKAFKSMATKRS